MISRIISHLKFEMFKINRIKEDSKILGKHLSTYLKNEDHYIERIDLIKQGQKLKDQLLDAYLFLKKDEAEFILHIPSFKSSPGGFSIFSDISDALNHMGIVTHCFEDEFSLRKSCMDASEKSILMISSSLDLIQKINLISILPILKEKEISLGLTAITLENNQNITEMQNILKLMKPNFVFSFNAQSYTSNSEYFKFYRENGIPILNIELSFNPKYHYPYNNPLVDFDFIFLASSNIEKRKRYYSWLSTIFKNYTGIINGPGWNENNYSIGKEHHAMIYSRAKVGLNLHINKSINYPDELNQRTYILSACGVPQICDNPKLLANRFDSSMILSATKPSEYVEGYEFLIKNPKLGNKMALKSLEHSYKNYSIYHRLESFLTDLENL